MIEEIKLLFNKDYLLNFFILPTFAIGSFYDARLVVWDINLSLIFSLFFIVFFLFSLKAIKNVNYLNGLSLCVIIYLIQNIINSFIWGINEFYDYSFSKYTCFVLISFPLCAYFCTFDTIIKYKVFLLQLSVVSLFLIILGTLQILLGNAGERLSVLGGGPIVFSRWVGFFVIYIIFFVNCSNYLKICFFCLCIVLMFFSGSKGPLIFLLITLLLFRLKKIKTYLYIFFLVFIVFLFKDILLFIAKDYPAFVRLFGLDSSSNFVTGTSSNARINLYVDSLNCISNNLFGYGIGNFSVYCDPNKILGYSGYPHNIFIELFIESGIIVLLMFFWILYLVYKKINFVINHPEVSNYYKGILSIWFFYLFNSLVSGDLSDARFLIVFTGMVLSMKFNLLFNEKINIHPSIL